MDHATASRTEVILTNPAVKTSASLRALGAIHHQLFSSLENLAHLALENGPLDQQESLPVQLDLHVRVEALVQDLRLLVVEPFALV